MHQRKKRIFLLAAIMASLVAAVSFINSRLLYRTALFEQRRRLSELVHSQAALIQEMNLANIELEKVYGFGHAQQLTLRQLMTAHQKFRIGSKTGEFTLARMVGDTIRFLIVNGQNVSEDSPLAHVPMNSSLGQPMAKALSMQSGTLIGRDYEGTEVLAAYEPLFLTYEVLGIVAKIDIQEIRAPFVRANIIVSVIGLGFVLVGLFFFYRTTEPILRDLRRSEEQYRDLVERADSLIVRVDGKGRILFANTCAQKQLGREMEDLYQADACRLLVKSDSDVECREGADDLLRLMGESGTPRALPITLSNGLTAWISWAVHPIQGSDGRLEELLCIGNDVTAQYLAQRSKRDIEERFRAIAKASPVGIIITDMTGNLVYANEHMHELTGLSAVELAGAGWLKRIRGEDRDWIMKSWFRKKEPKPMARSEFQLRRLDGTALWVLGQRVPMQNVDGALIGYVATLTDITRIKDTEAKHKRLSTAIDQSADAVVITDLAGDILYVNPAFEIITGYSGEEVRGRNPRFLQSGEHDADFYARLWETISAGDVWYGRFINKRKNGEIYQQEASIGPVRDQNGKIVNFVEVARDVTEQLILEAQLRHAQKLESIGELAAGIAHEINTPTQFVDNNIRFMGTSFKTLLDMVGNCRDLVNALLDKRDEQTVLDLAERALDQEELQYLSEDIPNAVEESLAGLRRISEIVQSIKLLAHPGEVEMNYHDVNGIIRNSVTVSTNEWKYVADIVMELDEDLAPVNCLAGELGQVLLNLIVNAAHAIEARFGPTPERKGSIVIRSFREGGMAVIQVGDNGSGMPSEVIARAFDPFFTTKEVGRGTGQGLAIAHSVVVGRHGGSIDIDSVEGGGTTFTVKLPFVPPSQPSQDDS